MQRLKNILRFTNITPNVPVSLPHGLQTSLGLKLTPDLVVPVPATGFTVTADNTNITVAGNGAAVDVYCESWHTIERAFGDAITTSLVPQPFVIGEGARPPFVPDQPATRIYARLTGSDTNGNGSLANPFRTFQRAVKAIPQNGIFGGQRFVVDITGIGVEVLPPNYTLDVFNNPGGFDFTQAVPDALANDLPFAFVEALDIQAKPQPAASVAPADQTLTPGDIISITPDADTNLFVIQTTKSYPQDSLKGLFLQDTQSIAGVIWHNTAGPNSTIYVTRANVPDLPSLITPYDSPPTPPLMIVEPSAELRTTKSATSKLAGGFIIAGSGRVGFRGLRIRLDASFDTNTTTFDVMQWGSSTVFFEMCDLDGIGLPHAGAETTFLNTLIRDKIFVAMIPVKFLGSMMWNVPSVVTAWSDPESAFNAIGFVIEGCGPIGPRYDSICRIGRGPGMEIALRYGVIRNSVNDANFGLFADPSDAPAPFVPNSVPLANQIPGHGVAFKGHHLTVDHVKIFGCAGDAINANDGAYGLVEVRSVTGGEVAVPLVFSDLPNTSNAGFGINLSGVQCRVTDNYPIGNTPLSTVHGVLGDVQVGSIAPIAWPAPANTPDFAGPAATGARLFVDP